MQISMLQSKIHRVTTTHSELNYEGSCAIDSLLLKASNIRPYQAIDIYNVTNGERFSTYAIAAEEGSGVISVNGAAARKAAPGDILIIAAYCIIDSQENFQPNLVYVDKANRIKEIKNSIPTQLAD